MAITPECFSHMLSPLMALASGKVAVILEGGYCIQSLSDSAAITLRTLLGHPCPRLVENLQEPCTSIKESILNCIHSHRSYWKCLQSFETYSVKDSAEDVHHQVIQSYLGPNHHQNDMLLVIFIQYIQQRKQIWFIKDYLG